MTWNKITDELARIGGIVGEWKENRDVGALERELVLDKLRMVYEQVKFGVAEPAKAPVAEPHPTAPEEPVKECCAAKEEAPEEDDVLSAFMEDVVTAKKEEMLLGGEEPVARPKLDRSAILSLYGDEAGNGAPGGEPAVSVPAEAPVSEEVLPQGDDVLEAIGIAGNSAAPAPADEPAVSNGKTVLGETLAHSETLADAYARGGAREDIASRIVGGRIGSLRGSIGINDKFLMIRDLFGGDAGAYEQAIDRFDAFADLDDAMLHIHDTYNWNPDGEGVKLLIDLLTRKLS